MFMTRVTELLDIDHPIVGGVMMHISKPEFVAAISNAGALGMMASAMFDSQDKFRQAVHQVKSLTDKPFGVNLTFLPTLRPPDYPAYINVCIEEGVKFIETAGRNPEPYMAQIKSAGIMVVHTPNLRRQAVPYVDMALCQACRTCPGRAVCRGKSLLQLDPTEPPFVGGNRC